MIASRAHLQERPENRLATSCANLAKEAVMVLRTIHVVSVPDIRPMKFLLAVIAHKARVVIMQISRHGCRLLVYDLSARRADRKRGKANPLVALRAEKSVIRPIVVLSVRNWFLASTATDKAAWMERLCSRSDDVPYDWLRARVAFDHFLGWG